MPAGPNMYPPVYNAPGGGSMMMASGEMCQISVPNSVVGAIIGAGGSIIKQIMQDSNAHVTVSGCWHDEYSVYTLELLFRIVLLHAVYILDPPRLRTMCHKGLILL